MPAWCCRNRLCRLTWTARWRRHWPTPRSVRVLQDGSLDATFANISILEWNGDVQAPVTPPDSNWGSISDLRTILATKGSVTFNDHYGNVYTTAYISQSGAEKSASPMWDGASNEFRINVTIMAEGS